MGFVATSIPKLAHPAPVTSSVKAVDNSADAGGNVPRVTICAGLPKNARKNFISMLVSAAPCV